MPKLIDGTDYIQSGPSNAPTVVLIHGLGLRKEVWQWLTPELAKTYNVITYDLYGHADSPIQQGEPSLKLFSEQLRKVLDACGVGAAAVVGFSLGGMIARRFAQDHQSRVHALAILHSPHQRTDAAQEAILARVEQARLSGSAVTVEAALERWFSTTYRVNRPDVMDQVRGWVLSNVIEIYHRNYRVLADGIDEIIRPTPPINAPMLVITGDEDYGNGPEMARAIAAEIEGAETHILIGLRHMALVEDPISTATLLLKFLEQHLIESPS